MVVTWLGRGLERELRAFQMYVADFPVTTITDPNDPTQAQALLDSVLALEADGR